MKSRYYFPSLLLVACCLSSGLTLPLRAQMTDFVNSTADDEFCYPWDDPETELDETSDGNVEDALHRKTLRAALLEAANLNDAQGGPAVITITVSGTITLTQGTLYPTDGSTIKSTANITINGGSTIIAMSLGNNTTIDNLNFTGGQFILTITGDLNKIINCTFENPAYDAIDVLGDFNRIELNWIGGSLQNGIFVSGDYNAIQRNDIGFFGGAPSNNGVGIFIIGSHNVIGGLLELKLGNTICYNSGAGISLVGMRDADVPCESNIIKGNYIGTTRDSQSGRGNLYGIQTVGDSSTIIQRNVICGNTNAGILIGDGSQYASISYNFIGVDSAVQYRLPNKEGINLGPGSSSCEVFYNNISGNTKSGIAVVGGHDILNEPSHYHIIYGNKVTQNGEHGLFLAARAQENIIGASLTTDFYPNQFYRNAEAGVAIATSIGFTEAYQNTVRKNSFLDNGKRGIIIVNAQDDIDPPTLTGYYRAVGIRRAIVTGSHDRPGSRIDFYTGQKQVTNHLEGQRWLDEGTLGPSQAEFNFTIPVPNARYILATATDPNGNTSEFSDSLAINHTNRRRFRRGANTVSASVSPTSSSTGSVFPGSSGSAYSWSGPQNTPGFHPSNNQGSYVAQDTIVNGVGYWIRYDSEVNDSLTGFLQLEDTIEVIAGWNFIGSISDPIAVSQIASIPAGMATSEFFGYDSTYQVADTIQPGYAYWVKVSQSGSLILAVPDSLPPTNLITIVPDSEMPPEPPNEVVLGVHNDVLPLKYSLSEVYPNPFNPVAAIEFSVPEQSIVVITAYNLLGEEVATLLQEEKQPGNYRTNWNAGSLPSGVYYVRMSAGEFVQTKACVLIK